MYADYAFSNLETPGLLLILAINLLLFGDQELPELSQNIGVSKSCVPASQNLAAGASVPNLNRRQKRRSGDRWFVLEETNKIEAAR